jgi:hypothetical protein
MSWDELATKFLDLYVERLQARKPQLLDPAQTSVVEKVVEQYTSGRIDRAEAIEKMKSEAFRYVVDSFHLVHGSRTPILFYHEEETGLTLTDDAFRAIAGDGVRTVLAEVLFRWSELEDSFARAKDKRAGGSDFGMLA